MKDWFYVKEGDVFVNPAPIDAPLTGPMIEALESADYWKNKMPRRTYNMTADGWFYPQRNDCSDIAALGMTCHALFRRGMFDKKYMYQCPVKGGKWRDVFKYRISKRGEEYLAGLESEG